MKRDLFQECIEYVYNNFNILRFDYDCVTYTYTAMCVQRTSLQTQNYELYVHIFDLIQDFGLDNELTEDWYMEEDIDVEDVFEKLLDYFE